MKFIIKKYWTLLLFLCLTWLVQAQNKADYAYDFPINPSTKEWENLKTEDERFEAMQIPLELLKSMSTENLIITCLNYPAFGHYALFNFTDGINHLIQNFNGLQELLLREDAPAKMISLYVKLGISTTNIESIKTELWGMRLCYFELLLTKDEIIDKLNEDEKINLMKEVQKKISDKVNDSECRYSLFSIQPTFLITAKVLDRSNYQVFQQKKKENTKMESFLHTGNLQDLSLLNDLIEMGTHFINSK
jgi:hypothetical protein